VRLTKLYSYRIPTGLALRLASSLLAITCTLSREGGDPREYRSSMFLATTSFLRGVTFNELGWQLRRAGFPASWLRSVDLGTLYVAAACLALLS